MSKLPKHQEPNELQQISDFVAPLRERVPEPGREQKLAELLAYSQTLGAPVIAGGIVGWIISRLGITQRLFTQLLISVGVTGTVAAAAVIGGILMFSANQTATPLPADAYPTTTPVINQMLNNEDGETEQLSVEATATSESTATPEPTATEELTPTITITSTLRPTVAPIKPILPTATSKPPTPKPPQPTATNVSSAESITASFVTPQQGEYVYGVGNTRFEVIAYDTSVGSANGDGIASVSFTLTKLDGTPIHTFTDSAAGFCEFPNDTHCDTMGQELWATLVNDQYRLTAAITSQAGYAKTISVTFYIQVNE